tara:strand:+ start:594 stop:791 length:198 start_codon:yes stop_codon:yes gene_type:complete
MFNDPREEIKEKALNNSKLMKIEDQVAKPDLNEINVPKGLYENLPNIENTATIEDEEEDAEDDEH